ncbi:hypothetical protein [Acetobacter lovaniensis]|uniref:Burkholderia phage Bcep781 gp06 n=1 Tax=Acetobacter lovaniensis TaxID=104100 RepID=A0A841QI39_9PROT|nr:hypothetical protein [Acetobacter lovaniensis]MBB6457894.1 hypothetical protein [Acetobacter lovaniensis]NHN82157.1 hypothetical protein [Acetobacter lovaniensis]GBQ66234.1 hypothetical protein AA0474_1060 [Acetobacter lovaniensis NRIC 0474]
MIDIFAPAGNLCAPINPHITGTLQGSTGNVINDDGSVTPQYTTVSVEMEVQAVSSQDLRQIENINQQADMRSVYVRGAVRALNRPLQMGGDILTFYGSDWLVTQQLEEWGNGEWSKVLVTRQMPTTS